MLEVVYTGPKAEKFKISFEKLIEPGIINIFDLNYSPFKEEGKSILRVASSIDMGYTIDTAIFANPTKKESNQEIVCIEGD